MQEIDILEVLVAMFLVLLIIQAPSILLTSWSHIINSYNLSIEMKLLSITIIGKS
jgi:hypothetical protein